MAFVMAFFYKRKKSSHTYCSNKEAAMGIIVVSLPCTAYLCGSLIVF